MAEPRRTKTVEQAGGDEGVNLSSLMKRKEIKEVIRETSQIRVNLADQSEEQYPLHIRSFEREKQESPFSSKIYRKYEDSLTFSPSNKSPTRKGEDNKSVIIPVESNIKIENPEEEDKTPQNDEDEKKHPKKFDCFGIINEDDNFLVIILKVIFVIIFLPFVLLYKFGEFLVPKCIIPSFKWLIKIVDAFCNILLNLLSWVYNTIEACLEMIARCFGCIYATAFKPIVDSIGRCYEKFCSSLEKSCEAFGNCVGAICDSIGKCCTAIWNPICKLLKLIKDYCQKCCLGVFKGFKACCSPIYQCVSGVCKRVGECCNFIWEKVIGGFFKTLEKYIFKPIGKFVSSICKGIFDFVIVPIGKCFKAIFNAFSGCFKAINKHIFKPIGKAINKIIIKPIETVFKAIGKFFSSLTKALFVENNNR